MLTASSFSPWTANSSGETSLYADACQSMKFSSGIFPPDLQLVVQAVFGPETVRFIVRFLRQWNEGQRLHQGQTRMIPQQALNNIRGRVPCGESDCRILQDEVHLQASQSSIPPTQQLIENGGRMRLGDDRPDNQGHDGTEGARIVGRRIRGKYIFDALHAALKMAFSRHVLPSGSRRD